MAEKTEKQKIGRLGEDIAQKYLENKGFSVIGQNYLKKCGEIDIIAQKRGIIHFIEVKTVSELANSEPAGFTAWPQTLGRSETSKEFRQDTSRPELYNVPRETDSYRPEDNIHPAKLKRLARTIQVYLLEKYPKDEPEWVLNAVIVVVDLVNHKARVKFLEDIVL